MHLHELRVGTLAHCESSNVFQKCEILTSHFLHFGVVCKSPYVMARNMFQEDDNLWEVSTIDITQPANTWTFSKNSLYIGSDRYKLSKRDQYRTTFELGMFDLHFNYLRLKYEEQSCAYNHNFSYHSYLRSAIEDHVRQSKPGSDIICPPILTPWLWRTLFGYLHNRKSRKVFWDTWCELPQSGRPLPDYPPLSCASLVDFRINIYFTKH